MFYYFFSLHFDRSTIQKVEKKNLSFNSPLCSKFQTQFTGTVVGKRLRVRPDWKASERATCDSLAFRLRLCCCSPACVEPVPRPRVERHRSENRTGSTAKRCRLRAQQHRSRASVSMATYLTKHMFYLFFVARFSVWPYPYSSPWWWRQQGPLKRWYNSTRLHGATTQKTAIFSRAANPKFIILNILSAIPNLSRYVRNSWKRDGPSKPLCTVYTVSKYGVSKRKRYV
jgi:hypothetical protein